MRLHRRGRQFGAGICGVTHRPGSRPPIPRTQPGGSWRKPGGGTQSHETRNKKKQEEENRKCRPNFHRPLIAFAPTGPTADTPGPTAGENLGGRSHRASPWRPHPRPGRYGRAGERVDRGLSFTSSLSFTLTPCSIALAASCNQDRECTHGRRERGGCGVVVSRGPKRQRQNQEET